MHKIFCEKSEFGFDKPDPRGRSNAAHSRFPRGENSNVVEKSVKRWDIHTFAVDNFVDNVDNDKKYPYFYSENIKTFGL